VIDESWEQTFAFIRKKLNVASVGFPAPHFEEEAVVGQDFKTLKLSDYKGTERLTRHTHQLLFSPNVLVVVVVVVVMLIIARPQASTWCSFSTRLISPSSALPSCLPSPTASRSSRPSTPR
jgi:hypothetical protein